MIEIDVLIGGDLQRTIQSAQLLEYDVDLVFNGAHFGTFVLPASDPAVAVLEEEDVVIRVRHSSGVTFTAWLEDEGGAFGDLEDTDRAFSFRSTWSVLDDTLAVVVPENPISPRQTVEGRSDLAQAVATGPTTAGTVTNQRGYFVWQGSTAEDAVLDIVGRNLARVGYEVVLPESLGRGASPARPDIRMRTLAEAVLPVLEPAGLGIEVIANGDTLRVKITEPDEYSQLLTTAGPIRPGGKWKKTRPTATRVLVGGPGEEAARQWWPVVDTDLEARFGRVIEVARDATGAKLTWPETFNDAAQVPKYYLSASDADVSPELKAAFVKYLNEAGADALADKTPVSSLQVELAERGGFKLGAYNLGDRLRLQERRGVGPVFEDRVSRVRVARSRTSDEVVTPVIGGFEDSPERQMWSAISTIAARQRRQATDK